eukprot:352749-Chlamydomonas_euryale.AAC.12
MTCECRSRRWFKTSLLVFTSMFPSGMHLTATSERLPSASTPVHKPTAPKAPAPRRFIQVYFGCSARSCSGGWAMAATRHSELQPGVAGDQALPAGHNKRRQV